MSSSDCQRQQESLKRMWQEGQPSGHIFKRFATSSNPRKPLLHDMPAVTVVVEGRSICHRISLQKHSGYPSLARALNKMLVDQESGCRDDDDDVDLRNAVPGHVIAYEDMENDLLLVGDLNWKDFVRVAKRIRIVPVKPRSRNLKQAC